MELLLLRGSVLQSVFHSHALNVRHPNYKCTRTAFSPAASIVDNHKLQSFSVLLLILTRALQALSDPHCQSMCLSIIYVGNSDAKYLGN